MQHPLAAVAWAVLEVSRQSLTGSLPALSGEQRLPELSDSVIVARDSLGIPTIGARTREDSVRAQGFVHAQDRLFQMDVMRRYAAGRLAEIVGERGLPSDLEMRPYRFEDVAARTLARLPAEHRALLQAYTQGVNAGMQSLGAAPPEYALLGVAPEPWRETDCLLVGSFMHWSLDLAGPAERSRAVMHAALKPEALALLLPDTSRFDAPILGDDGMPAPQAADAPTTLPAHVARPAPAGGDPGEPPGVRYPARIPKNSAVARAPIETAPAEFAPALASHLAAPTVWAAALREGAAGSNAWAIAGARTRDGRAILAGDMHLPVTAPSLWYRATLAWGGGAAEAPRVRVCGVSLPGMPMIVAGSNTRVAWSFTNTTADFHDLILIETDPDNPARYRTPEGWEEFRTVRESVRIKGGEERVLELQLTRWGVVTDHDWQGRPRVSIWTALDHQTQNLNVLEMAQAENVDQAVRIAASWRGPSQNVVIADHTGRIGWVVSGYLPRREGFDGTVPVSWAAPGVGWKGEVDESQRPMLVDPPSGFIHTANARAVGEDQARRLGRLWAFPYRAYRIREVLRAHAPLDEHDMLSLQLDVRCEPIDAVRDAIAAAVAPDEADENLRRAREVAIAWDGYADADSVGFGLLMAVRDRMSWRLREAAFAPCRALDPSFTYFHPMGEEALQRVLREREPALLPAGEDWATFVRAAVQHTLAERDPATGEPRVLNRPWGEVHRMRVEHPIAGAVPGLGDLFNMEEAAAPGWMQTVRVHTQSLSASQRMVVSPGREEEAILHIPCGQSGHPLSPHYRDQHRAWVLGLPTPMLPGPTAHVLNLTP